MLNAKNHEKEGEIIAQAGRKGAVTLATNMAGRGVDIILGGNPPDKAEAEEVRALGGLHVIGTERHESRRIDNQLRGRAGRQGDPGSTQFFVSLDDDLMRIFGTERVKSMMTSLGIDDETPIESKMVTRSLERAQERVESHHFDTRKHVLEYDDVLNRHRMTIYDERRDLLTARELNPHDEILRMMETEVERVVLFHTTKTEADVPAEFAEKKSGDWDPKEIIEALGTIVPLGEESTSTIRETLKMISRDKEELARQRTTVIETVMKSIKTKYEEITGKVPTPEIMERLERGTLLRAMDTMWMRHLDDMTYLRRTIGLQGYAQRDPLVEYKKEAYRLYSLLRHAIDREVVYNIFKIFDQAIQANAAIEAAPKMMAALNKMLGGGGNSSKTGG
jgi:preprotein translocase subunit SecA